MIELTYAHLTSPDFGKALKKLVDSEEIKKVDLLRKISKIYKAVVEADKERLDLHQKLLKNLGTQDPESKTQKLYIAVGNQESWDTEFSKIMDTKILIEQEPLKFSDVSVCKLTAGDIAALDSILAE